MMDFCMTVSVSGKRSSRFSVEINHGGDFVGHGGSRRYIDGHAVWFDQLDKMTWSTIMLENIVEDIGWEMAGRVMMVASWRTVVMKMLY